MHSGTGFLPCGREHRVSCVQVLWDYQQFLHYVQNYLKSLPNYSVSEQLIEQGSATVERSCSSLLEALFLFPGCCPAREGRLGLGQVSSPEAFEMVMSWRFYCW